jgi:hypothetical protein
MKKKQIISVSILAFVVIALVGCDQAKKPVANVNSMPAKNQVVAGTHKAGNEEVILSFTLKRRNKKVLLCRDTANSYLVYRFGTEDHLELEYPSVLDTTSWKLFKYNGYLRGGGVQNAAMSEYSVSFVNNGTTYKIFQKASVEDNSQEVGLIVISNNNETKLTGELNSVSGGLYQLTDNKDLIRNEVVN